MVSTNVRVSYCRLICRAHPHPRIVTFYGVSTTDPKYFGIVIQYFELGDLRRLLDYKNTHLSPQQMWQLIKDIAQVHFKTLLVASQQAA